MGEEDGVGEGVVRGGGPDEEGGEVFVEHLSVVAAVAADSDRLGQGGVDGLRSLFKLVLVMCVKAGFDSGRSWA